MEETKQVKLSAPEEPKKMSYEDLENIAKQLASQNEALRAKLASQGYAQAVQRLGFQINVLQIISSNPSHKFTTKFVEDTYKEVEEALSVPEANVSEKKDNNEQ